MLYILLQLCLLTDTDIKLTQKTILLQLDELPTYVSQLIILALN